MPPRQESQSRTATPVDGEVRSARSDREVRAPLPKWRGRRLARRARPPSSRLRLAAGTQTRMAARST
eukprot:485820-Pleurochrysis_carterae.AAC.1